MHNNRCLNVKTEKIMRRLIFSDLFTFIVRIYHSVDCYLIHQKLVKINIFTQLWIITDKYNSIRYIFFVLDNQLFILHTIILTTDELAL